MRFVLKIEDDTYTCTDNYYVKFVKDPYDKYIEYLLKDSGLDTYVNTYFNTLLPMEYGADTSVDTIINLNDKVEKKCEIYVITSTPEETTTIIQDIVDKNNLYGSFSIYFVSQIDDDVALRENKGNFERISFNTFD